MGARIARGWAAFWLAVSFLTVLPTPRLDWSGVRLGRAAVWFPWVGLALGGLLWTVQSVGLRLWGPGVTGALVVVAWAALTGGLHLDGLADCGDGLLPPVDRERRLAILADPRLGSFGAIVLVSVLLLKATAAASVPPAGLILAPVWARWLLLFAATQPQARPGGMGAAFSADLTPATLALASIAPVGVVALVAAGGHGAREEIAALTAAAAAAGMIALARVRLGGVTGDVYGAIVELAELAVLLIYAVHGS
jgi:adenosylcobinamide-GDP ribazoletransferase